MHMKKEKFTGSRQDPYSRLAQVSSFINLFLSSLLVSFCFIVFLLLLFFLFSLGKIAISVFMNLLPGIGA